MPPKAAAPKTKAQAPQQKPAAKKAEGPKAPVVKQTVKGVHVKGLQDESVDAVKKAFTSIGQVSSVRLRRNKYALVHFADGESVQKAVQRFNDRKINDHHVTVAPAKAPAPVDEHENSTVVFVAPVYRQSTKRKAILELFADCGKVTRLRTYANNTAFVYFETPEGAKNAIKNKNGTKFHDVELRIKPSVRSLQKDKKKEERRRKLIEVHHWMQEHREQKK